jgi:hypothetical protein
MFKNKNRIIGRLKIIDRPAVICFVTKLQAISKIVDHSQEQGKSRRKSAGYT